MLSIKDIIPINSKYALCLPVDKDSVLIQVGGSQIRAEVIKTDEQVSLLKLPIEVNYFTSGQNNNTLMIKNPEQKLVTLLRQKGGEDKPPATEEDLSLYKAMGASYLCIARKAEIEFPKAIGIATAVYVQVLEGKHGGLIKDLGDKKLEREKLFAGAEFQILTTALQVCPDSVPKDVQQKVNEILKNN